MREARRGPLRLLLVDVTRPAARRSALRFLLVAGAGVVLALFASAIATTLDARGVANSIASLEAERTTLEPVVAKAKALESRLASARTRERALHAIVARRQAWSLKLDRLGEIVAPSPDVWLTEIKLVLQQGGPALRVGLCMAGDDLRRLAVLRERLTSDGVFFEGFERIESPRITVNPANPARQVKTFMEMPFTCVSKEAP